MKHTIHIKHFLPYSPPLVWRALTDAQLLGKWFMKNDLQPEVGHEFTFRMAPQKGWNGITHCKVTSMEPQRHIAYTYRGQASGEKTLACAGIHSEKAGNMAKGIFARLDTVLSFTLLPTCGGTIIEMKQSGFEGLKLVIVGLVMQKGWKKQLKRRLPRLLEEMDRQTVIAE